MVEMALESGYPASSLKERVYALVECVGFMFQAKAAINREY
jgi:hypothetical protein